VCYMVCDVPLGLREGQGSPDQGSVGHGLIIVSSVQGVWLVRGLWGMV
jgi:hypothetical protein